MTFDDFVKANEKVVDEIRHTAWSIHESVGQKYDKTLPYGHHLSMTADTAVKYGSKVISRQSDILPIIFAAYFHDSIEDARLSYNDVTAVAERFMTKEQAFIAAEIVYALTNDKGRTRQERAGERYYQGIRETPYAPFMKLCDRLANMSYSYACSNEANNRMHEVYRREWPHFIQALKVNNGDIRFSLPDDMIEEIELLLS